MLARLRAACAVAGYTREVLAERMQSGLGPGSPGARAIQTRRLGADRLSTLARLLWLGDPVERAAAVEAIEPADVAELAGVGLLALDRDLVRAPFRIAPHEGLLLASDGADYASRASEGVAGPNPSARTLDGLTVRRPVGAALDLGTGCGTQALRVAGHAAEVVGVDVNPRALAFAELNAKLNGIANVCWATGSWLEPVAGRRFDLIVANPPYVISPDAEFLYRDSGQQGDALSRSLIEALPGALADGGIAQMICNWIGPREGDWSEPLRAWVKGSGCEVLLIRFDTLDPLTYAAGWNEPLLAAGIEVFERALDRWLDHYERLGVERIGFGLVVLRRRANGVEGVRALDATGSPTGPCGEHVLRLLDAGRELTRLADDRALLAEPLRLVAGHRIDQTLSRDEGRYRSHPARVRILPGLPVEALVDPDALDMLFKCDGTRPLGRLVDAAAAAGGRDRDALARTAVTAARELLGLGMATAGAQDSSQ